MRPTHIVCFVLAVALHVFVVLRFFDLDSLLDHEPKPNEELSLTMEWIEKARDLIEPAEPVTPPEAEPEPEPEKLPPPPAQDQSDEAPPEDSATQAAKTGGGQEAPVEAPTPEPKPEPQQPEPPQPEPQPPEPPQPEPEPTPAPLPAPEPEPQPKPEPQPEPEPEPLERLPEPQPQPEPAQEPEPIPEPVPQGPHFSAAGPGDSVSDLPLPANLFDGPPRARLVHDLRNGFRENLDRLGGLIVLYPNSREPRYFLELVPGGGTQTRRVGRSTPGGQALVRRLSGATVIDLTSSSPFLSMRHAISRSIGLGRDKLQMLAIVPDSIRARMESQTRATVERFGLDPAQTRAIFGQLTDDPSAPLQVTGYLDASGRRFALRNDSE